MKDLMDKLNEGLLDGFKLRKLFTQLQGAVADEYERLIDENPKRFRNGKQVLDSVYDFAKKEYDRIITMDGALPFNQWWREFSDAHARVLDRIVFN